MRQGVMLCYAFSEKRFASWPKPVICQPKIEGDRCRAVISYEDDIVDVTLLTSQGNEITHLQHINAQLADAVVKLPFYERVLELDGELYSHELKHQNIRSVVSRRVNQHPKSDIIEYHIFDVIKEEVTQERRAAYLEQVLGPRLNTYPNLVVVDAEHAITLDDVSHHLSCYIRSGFEGIILRNPAGYYKRVRSVDIMKLKPRKEGWFKIIAYAEEIDKEGFRKNAMGSFNCERSDGRTFWVGTGTIFTKEFRERSWKNKQDYLGRKALVKFQDWTMNGKPYFPSLVAITD